MSYFQTFFKISVDNPMAMWYDRRLEVEVEEGLTL